MTFVEFAKSLEKQSRIMHKFLEASNARGEKIDQYYRELMKPVREERKRLAKLRVK